MPNCRLIVNSCQSRKPLQEVWLRCLAESWPDCPFPLSIISPELDKGWNANLIDCLEQLSEDFILMMLDDNYLEPSVHYTANMAAVVDTMVAHPDIAFIKLQAGGAHAPEIFFPEWHRIREYDRKHHPFKRTNLIPAMYRRTWLQRFAKAVLAVCGSARDVGRNGALEFEITGTLLTENPVAWPERMFGIHRPNPDGGGGDSLLTCIANDAVTDGKVRDIPSLRRLCEGIAGIEAYL